MFLQRRTRDHDVLMIKSFISWTATTVALVSPNLFALSHFVSPESANPVPPFTNWTTAAPTIQQAVDAAAPGDDIVVTNGIYGAVNVYKPLCLRSANGPLVTIIDPLRQNRCAYLAEGASLAGFWLRHGAGDFFGGAVLCASSNVLLRNCMITESRVYTNSNGSVLGSGGGVYGGTLYNCLVVSNSAAVSGGGASSSTLYNCTVSANRSDRHSGGVYASALTNCIVYFNTALDFPNYRLSDLNYSCTTPMPTNGAGNLTNAPQFVDPAGMDLRLLGISPCIDTGDNSQVLTSDDLAGRPRVIRGKVDMGAYEFPGTNSLTFYAWVQHHGVRIDGTADYDDNDGDGMNNWQEWVCFTCPTNPLKNLRMVSAVPIGTNVTVRWKTETGVKYFVERSSDLRSFTCLVTNIMVSTSEAVFTDTNSPGRGPVFYRVGVRAPP